MPHKYEEARKRAARNYYLRNREKIIARTREHKETYVNLNRRDMKSHLRYILGKARLRIKWECTITPEDLYDLFEKQNGLCAYSKVPLTYVAYDLNMASLDRIDSTVGYVKENIQLVCTAVNRMKQEFSEKDFLKYCELITNERKRILDSET